MKDLYYISDNERWIDGWRGYYSATKDGKVKSYCGDGVIYMTPSFSEDRSCNKYGTVTFRVGDRVEYHHVSRLIYETFVRPLRKDERVVCKNGNRRDLRLDNLEVKSFHEVNADPNRIEKDRAKKYTEILLEREDGQIYCFKGYTNAKEECGISGSRLRKLIRNAEKAGLDYFVCRGMIYKFIVVRTARYANADPNNARKKAAQSMTMVEKEFTQN